MSSLVQYENALDFVNLQGLRGYLCLSVLPTPTGSCYACRKLQRPIMADRVILIEVHVANFRGGTRQVLFEAAHTGGVRSLADPNRQRTQAENVAEKSFRWDQPHTTDGVGMSTLVPGLHRWPSTVARSRGDQFTQACTAKLSVGAARSRFR